MTEGKSALNSSRLLISLRVYWKVTPSPLAIGVFYEKLHPPYSQWQCIMKSYSLPIHDGSVTWKATTSPLTMGVFNEKLQPQFLQWECFMKNDTFPTRNGSVSWKATASTFAMRVFHEKLQLPHSQLEWFMKGYTLNSRNGSVSWKTTPFPLAVGVYHEKLQLQFSQWECLVTESCSLPTHNGSDSWKAILSIGSVSWKATASPHAMGVFHKKLQPQFSQWEWFMKSYSLPTRNGSVSLNTR